ncbi:hypothetical protein [Variovorax sp. LjRoot178]|uniref:hypothetical protein n=1 Tax=Variovorax sp. LjRoot178 TaxID=3342277 RepID=UPI003ECD915C
MRKIAIGTVAATVLAVGALAIGTWSGRALAEATQQRLRGLWPEVMTMPQEDRMLLVWLSFECNLTLQPAGQGETIGCLRKAAATEAASERFQAPATQLEQLLRSAQRAPGA